VLRCRIETPPRASAYRCATADRYTDVDSRGFATGQLADRILALHGWAALAVVFLLPALEASVFVGVVVPGEIAVLLGGVLAFQHRVSLPAVVAAAICGAVVGDTVGYLVGRRWGRAILHSSLGRLVSHEHLDRAERFLATRGGPAVFLGRFTAALRALIPGLAGMARLRYRTFAAYNALGGAVWASGFVLLGYAAGSGWRRVERTAGRASLLLLVVLVVVGAVVLAARWIAGHPDRVRALADRLLDRPWVVRLRGRYQRQLAFLARRLQPQGAVGLTLTLTAAALVAAGWAFGAVLQDVLAGNEGGALLDAPVQRFFLAHREAWLTTVMRGVTNLGNAAVLIGLLLLIGLAWWWRRRTWRPLWSLAGAYLGAWVLSETVKDLTHRARPPAAQAIGHWTGYAFPSGHTTKAAAVYGMLAALLATTPRWGRKVSVWTVAALLAGLIGLSRLYLGAHWLTDVLGALTLGATWLFVLLAATRTVDALHAARGDAQPTPPDRPPPREPEISAEDNALVEPARPVPHRRGAR
jgi:membrane protein DedA with SNARE-associated domain/membrane-associated phospholipid phosphatase